MAGLVCFFAEGVGVCRADPLGLGGVLDGGSDQQAGASSAESRGAVKLEVGWTVRRAYVGVNRPIEVTLRLTGAVGVEHGFRGVELELIDAGSTVLADGRGVGGRVVGRSAVRVGPSGVVELDLASRFPPIWAGGAPQVFYVQASVDGVRVGAPLVVEPMVRPARVRNGLEARLERAALLLSGGSESDRDSQLAFIENLLALPVPVKRSLRDEVVVESWRAEGGGAVLGGVRVSVRRDVVMRTSLGEMVFRLRPDQAGETCWRFMELVGGGWYDGTVFHRVVAADGAGRPFVVQGGDPSGTGFGGVGFGVDYEVSELEHAFGVLSLVRSGDDPNSGGSQFVVCLSRAGCERLDGVQVSFGELINGAEVLSAIASVPVRAREPGGAVDRPVQPPLIERAFLVASGPVGSRSRVEPRGVGRRAPIPR